MKQFLDPEWITSYNKNKSIYRNSDWRNVEVDHFGGGGIIIKGFEEFCNGPCSISIDIDKNEIYFDSYFMSLINDMENALPSYMKELEVVQFSRENKPRLGIKFYEVNTSRIDDSIKLIAKKHDGPYSLY